MASRRPSAKRFTLAPTCTDTALQIKKAYTPFFSRIHTSRFLRFDTAWRRIFTPYTTLYRSTPGLTQLTWPSNKFTRAGPVLLLSISLRPNNNFFSYSFFLFYHHLRPREGEEVSGGIFRLLPVVQRDQSGHCRVGGDKKRRGHIFSFCFFLSVILHTNVVLFSFCINIIIKNTYNINCVDYEPCFLLTSNSDHVSPLLNACRVSVSCWDVLLAIAILDVEAQSWWIYLFGHVLEPRCVSILPFQLLVYRKVHVFN